MRLLNFVIIKLTLCLILGIVIGHFFQVSLKIATLSTGCFLLTLMLFYLNDRHRFITSIGFGITAAFATVSIGVLTINLHNPKNFSNHYTRATSIKANQLKTITFNIQEVLKSSNYHDKYIVNISKINDTLVTGKTLLNVKKDTFQKPLKTDLTYISRTDFKDLTKPLNPHQFNYKNYLEKKHIYHQLFITGNALLSLKQKKANRFSFTHRIREYINKKLKLYHFKPDEIAIINALLLGQKQGISKEVYTSYSHAGAIHILAVSGLHVGIILLILNIIFKPLNRFKHGPLIKVILLVIILWLFALIAGLTASVTRAVTMFSIITIALSLKRPTNIYNTLTISMFIILLFKPLFLFNVGFQLSYLAVLSIITIDPYLYKLWKPKYWITNKAWHTLTITISAQFGIIPISLYYFHLFPSLFFLSNLVIIPFLGGILSLGILVIILAVLNILPQFGADIFGYIISLMNRFISWISRQESFLFEDISFNLPLAITSYLLIIALFKFLFKRNLSNLRVFLVTIIIVQSILIYNKYNKPSNAFIIFHKNRYSLLGHATSNHFLILSDFDSITKTKNKIIRDYTIANNISTIEEQDITSIYLLNNKKLLIVDSLGVYNTISSIHPNFVLLRQSPKINLSRLIDTLKPIQIIADGSNYKSYITHWESICKKRKIPFHQTHKEGAFIINY